MNIEKERERENLAAHAKKTQTSVSPSKKKTNFNPSPLSYPTLTVPNKYIQQNQPTCSKTMEKDNFHWLNLSILLF